MRYTYDIQHKLIKKEGNYLARLTDKDAHKITDELNRQNRKIREYEIVLLQIKELLQEE